MGISASSGTWRVPDQPHDQCILSHVISAWSATWSVYDQPRDQCLISHVISACTATWSVHARSRDQCMISFVINAWSATLSVHDQAREECSIMCISGAWHRGSERVGDGPTPKRLGRRMNPIVTWRALCRKGHLQGGCPGQTCRISRNQPDPEEGVPFSLYIYIYFLGLQNHCRWWLQPWN